MWRRGLDVLLTWSLFFFIASLVSGILGFTDMAGSSGGIFRFIYFLCLFAFIVLFVGGLIVTKGKQPPV